MAQKLTWDDLLIQNISQQEAQLWLGYWSGWIKDRVVPVFMSKFGDWFLRRQDGSTVEFSVIEGTYSVIASTPEEFSALVNNADWQENHLLSLLVAQLHERNIVPPPGQCYAIAPHPVWTGTINLDQVMLMDTGIWQHICAQALGEKPPANKGP
jgi:hypothetical protein